MGPDAVTNADEHEQGQRYLRTKGKSTQPEHRGHILPFHVPDNEEILPRMKEVHHKERFTKGIESPTGD